MAYGSDALGGTLHVQTHSLDFSEQPRYKISAIGRLTTQQMEQTGHLRAQFSQRRLAATVAYSHRQFGDLWGGDTTQRQAPTGYSEQAFDAKFKFKLGKNAAITVLHQQLVQDSVPIFHKIALENFTINHIVPQKRQLSYARLEYQSAR